MSLSKIHYIVFTLLNFKNSQMVSFSTSDVYTVAFTYTLVYMSKVDK